MPLAEKSSGNRSSTIAFAPWWGRKGQRTGQVSGVGRRREAIQARRNRTALAMLHALPPALPPADAAAPADHRLCRSAPRYHSSPRNRKIPGAFCFSGRWRRPITVGAPGRVRIGSISEILSLCRSLRICSRGSPHSATPDRRSFPLLDLVAGARWRSRSSRRFQFSRRFLRPGSGWPLRGRFRWCIASLWWIVSLVPEGSGPSRLRCPRRRRTPTAMCRRPPGQNMDTRRARMGFLDPCGLGNCAIRSGTPSNWHSGFRPRSPRPRSRRCTAPRRSPTSRRRCARRREAARAPRRGREAGKTRQSKEERSTRARAPPVSGEPNRLTTPEVIEEYFAIGLHESACGDSCGGFAQTSPIQLKLKSDLSF